MNKRCSGCGVILQTIDESKPGFIPSLKYDNASYCKRCFRLTHYGEKNNNEIENTTLYITNYVNKTNIFKVFIIDLLNINNNTINIFNSIKGNKMLLISKIDLTFNSINYNHVINNIKEVYNIKSNIMMISINDELTINTFINYLNKNNIKELFLLGPTNSGKSSLINKMLDINKSLNDKLTISNKRNTTLDFINVKINDNLTIIDSPGFLINDYNYKINYKNIIKPITFNMKENEILLINDFYIKFNNNTSVTIYNYNDIDIKKYFKNIDIEYNLEVSSNTDICINGFGFIRVKNKNTLSISKLNKKLISIRNSIIN